MGGTFLLAAVKSFDANIAISTNFVLNAKNSNLSSYMTTLGIFLSANPGDYGDTLFIHANCYRTMHETSITNILQCNV